MPAPCTSQPHALQALAPGATVLPAAARVWAMGVRVLPDMGVPVHMAAAERLLWSPTARHVDLDGAGAAHLRRTIEPVTAAVCCLGFDLRASAPPIKPERREVELRVNAQMTEDESEAASDSSAAQGSLGLEEEMEMLDTGLQVTLSLP